MFTDLPHPKANMHPGIAISTGGSIELTDALYQQLYACPEIGAALWQGGEARTLYPQMVHQSVLLQQLLSQRGSS